jgi:hypothetical protein
MPGAIPTGLQPPKNVSNVFPSSILFGVFLTYKFAKRPMQKVPRAEMAAVEVTRSFLTSDTQRRYSVLFSQGTLPTAGGSLHTQVPPLSATMLALTAMM